MEATTESNGTSVSDERSRVGDDTLIGGNLDRATAEQLITGWTARLAACERQGIIAPNAHTRAALLTLMLHAMSDLVLNPETRAQVYGIVGVARDLVYDATESEVGLAGALRAHGVLAWIESHRGEPLETIAGIVIAVLQEDEWSEVVEALAHFGDPLELERGEALRRMWPHELRA